MSFGHFGICVSTVLVVPSKPYPHIRFNSCSRAKTCPSRKTLWVDGRVEILRKHGQCRKKGNKKPRINRGSSEAQTGFEPVHQGVADPRLTTWLLRPILLYSTYPESMNDSNGNRTRVTAVKGRCLNRLTMEPSQTCLSGCTNEPYLF